MKKSGKKWIALLATFCLATTAAALVGCGGKDGATGPAGPAGATGAPGKNAYEIAVDNGFEGTEEEWLASLKGETGAAAHEHTYDEDALPVTLLAPTIYKDGLGYKTCEKCDHIEPVLVGLPVAVAGEKATYKIPDDGSMVYFKLPIEKAGKVSIKVWDQFGTELSEYEYMSEIYAKYGDHAPQYVDFDAEWIKDDTAIIGVSAWDTKTISVAAYVLDGTETYDHVVNLKDINGNAVEAEKIEAYSNGEKVAEADVVDGVATFNMKPGDYMFEVVGLTGGTPASAVYTNNAMGGEFDITVLKSYTYTVTVKNGEELVDGATVSLYKADSIQEDGTPYYESYYGAYETATTENGVVSFTVSEAECYNQGSGEYEYKFLYKVSFTMDGLDDMHEPCAPINLNPNVDNGAVTLTVEEKKIPNWALDTAVPVEAKVASMMGNVNVAEAGDYTVSVYVANLSTLLMMGSYNLNAIVGDQTVSLTKDTDTTMVGTISLAAGDNLLKVVGDNAYLFTGATITVSKATSGEGGGEGGGGSEENANTLALDTPTTIKEEVEYTFTPATTGKYVFTPSGEKVSYTQCWTKEEWDNVQSGTPFAGYGEVGHLFLKENVEVTLIFTNGGDGDFTMTITQEAATALTIDSMGIAKTLKDDSIYTFTPTQDGTYKFTFSNVELTDSIQVWLLDDYVEMCAGSFGVAPIFDSMEQQSFEWSTPALKANETVTYVIDYNADTEAKYVIAAGDVYTEMTLGGESTVALGKYVFTAAESGTYYLYAKQCNMQGTALVCADAPSGGNEIWNGANATYYEFTLEAGQTFEFYVTKKPYYGLNRLYISNTQPGA